MMLITRFSRTPLLKKPNTAFGNRHEVHYTADDTNAFNTSHEHAQKNPILKNLFNKNSGNNTYQHPSIGRITCIKEHCPNSVCSKPCDEVKAREYVGHGTHSNYPGSVRLSSKDFNGVDRPQNGLMYSQPVINNDVTGANINKDRTKILNNDSEMKGSIHQHASREPAIQNNDIFP